MKTRKKEAAIYPYNRKVSSLIRYSEFLSDYEIVSAIAPNGYDIASKDISILEKRNPLDMPGTASFDEGISKCDILIVAEADENEQFKKVIIKNILKAMSRGKDIVSLYFFSYEEEEMLAKMADIYSVNYKSYKQFNNIDLPYSNSTEETYAPIIIVTSLNEDCLKFDVELQMKKSLQDAGYRISLIGTKHYSEMFGAHSFPDFMYDHSINIEERIVKLNAYVRYIERREAPQVIIVGIPGGLFPITEKLHQDYGRIAYEVGYALQSDLCICLMPPQSNFDMPAIFDRINFLLGIEPCCIGISNLRLNQDATKTGFQGISVDVIDESEVEEIIYEMQSDTKVPIINICKNNQNFPLEIIDEKIKEYYKLQNIYNGNSEVKIVKSNIFKWLEKVIYNLYPNLDRGMGIEQNWKLLSAVDLLYIIAEVVLNCKIMITSEDIYNGSTRSYTDFANLVKMKLEQQ